MNNKLSELKIKRDHKFNVGKKMGNQLWLHKNYVSEIMDLGAYDSFTEKLPTDFEYNILRWDEKKNELAFIHSPDFDTANEPLVGRIEKVTLVEGDYVVGKPVLPPKNPLIYHHKWTFVKDDYQGFDVTESKKRTIEWKTKLGIDKTISSKIGRLDFWNNWLKENNLMKRTIDSSVKDFISKEVFEESLPKVWKIYSEIDIDSRLENEKLDLQSEVFLTLENGEKVKQEISSANTARLQIPKTTNIIKETGIYKGDKVLLDVGCGSKNERFKKSVEDLGIEYNGCDLYNQKKETNLASIKRCMNGGANLVSLNNVLNTIAEESVRKSVLEQCKQALSSEDGIALILTYEGERNSKEKKWELESGQKIEKLTPIQTRAGWQNRMKTSEYLDEVKAVFGNVKQISLSGTKIIVASVNPSLNLDLKKQVRKNSKNKF